jgi:hypothetical protein
MALKFVEKTEKSPEKLPEGGDRFLWNELPESVKPVKKAEYARMLKGEKPPA